MFGNLLNIHFHKAHAAKLDAPPLYPRRLVAAQTLVEFILTRGRKVCDLPPILYSNARLFEPSLEPYFPLP